MRKILLALTALTLLAGLTACQKDVTMWSSCRPAADGNPTGTDGKYVLACRNGTWEPIMTVKEWLDISAGKRVTIAPLPTRPTTTTTTSTTTSTSTSTTTTSTTSTTTTSTTTTTVPSTVQTIDLGDAAAVVGGGCSNCAGATVDVTFGDGRTGSVSVYIKDNDEASDGGYDWEVSATTFEYLGGFEFESCDYPILSFRGRATIEDTSYRMDFDGEALGTTGSIDLDGPWNFTLWPAPGGGDQPTAYAESITVDWGGVSCRVDYV